MTARVAPPDSTDDCCCSCNCGASSQLPGLDLLRRWQWLELDGSCDGSFSGLDFSGPKNNAESTVELGLGLSKADCKRIKKEHRPVLEVVRQAFFEGKTIHLSYVLPAHSSVVQILLNMTAKTIKNLYGLTTRIEGSDVLKLKDVVAGDLDQRLADMTIQHFKHTVELLYYLKEYLMSMFGSALVNVGCSDKTDVLIILSQRALSCNLCEKLVHNTRVFQCVECNVSTICSECIQLPSGESYIRAHALSCQAIQQLICPVIQTMNFVHLCIRCYVPLHKKAEKLSHVVPDIFCKRNRNRKKKEFFFQKARCLVSGCKRDLCKTCLLKK